MRIAAKKPIVQALKRLGHLPQIDAENAVRELWDDDPYAARRIQDLLRKIADEPVEAPSRQETI